MYNMTMHYQKIYGFKRGRGKEITHNNESDAFKHTFMQAVISLKYGNTISNLGGILHERDGDKYSGQPVGERNMDLWNNSQGREIAKDLKRVYGSKLKNISEQQLDDLIAKKVVEKMHNGELITHPSDRRKYTGFAVDLDNSLLNNNIKNINENRVFTREDVRNMSKEEFKKYEPEIMKQVYAIGLPSQAEVIANEKKSKSFSFSHKDVADGGSWVTINGNHVLL